MVYPSVELTDLLTVDQLEMKTVLYWAERLVNLKVELDLLKVDVKVDEWEKMLGGSSAGYSVVWSERLSVLETVGQLVAQLD
jgi:hypothetical protein